MGYKVSIYEPQAGEENFSFEITNQENNELVHSSQSLKDKGGPKPKVWFEYEVDDSASESLIQRTEAQVAQIPKHLTILNYLKDEPKQYYNENKVNGRTFDELKDAKDKPLTQGFNEEAIQAVREGFNSLPDKTMLCTETNIQYLCDLRDKLGHNLDGIKELTAHILDSHEEHKAFSEKHKIKEKIPLSYLFKLGGIAKLDPLANHLWMKVVSMNDDAKLKPAHIVLPESIDYFKNFLQQSAKKTISHNSESKAVTKYLNEMVSGTTFNSKYYRALPPDIAKQALLEATKDAGIPNAEDFFKTLPIGSRPTVELKVVGNNEKAKATLLGQNEYRLSLEPGLQKDSVSWVLKYQDNTAKEQVVSLSAPDSYWRFGEIYNQLKEIEEKAKGDKNKMSKAVTGNEELQTKFQMIIQKQLNKEYETLCKLVGQEPQPMQAKAPSTPQPIEEQSQSVQAKAPSPLKQAGKAIKNFVLAIPSAPSKVYNWAKGLLKKTKKGEAKGEKNLSNVQDEKSNPAQGAQKENTEPPEESNIQKNVNVDDATLRERRNQPLSQPFSAYAEKESTTENEQTDKPEVKTDWTDDNFKNELSSLSGQLSNLSKGPEEQAFADPEKWQDILSDANAQLDAIGADDIDLDELPNRSKQESAPQPEISAANTKPDVPNEGAKIESNQPEQKTAQQAEAQTGWKRAEPASRSLGSRPFGGFLANRSTNPAPDKPPDSNNEPPTSKP